MFSDLNLALLAPMKVRPQDAESEMGIIKLTGGNARPAEARTGDALIDFEEVFSNAKVSVDPASQGRIAEPAENETPLGEGGGEPQGEGESTSGYESEPEGRHDDALAKDTSQILPTEIPDDQPSDDIPEEKLSVEPETKRFGIVTHVSRSPTEVSWHKPDTKISSEMQTTEVTAKAGPIVGYQPQVPKPEAQTSPQREVLRPVETSDIQVAPKLDASQIANPGNVIVASEMPLRVEAASTPHTVISTHNGPEAGPSDTPILPVQARTETVPNPKTAKASPEQKYSVARPVDETQWPTHRFQSQVPLSPTKMDIATDDVRVVRTRIDAADPSANEAAVQATPKAMATAPVAIAEKRPVSSNSVVEQSRVPKATPEATPAPTRNVPQRPSSEIERDPQTVEVKTRALLPSSDAPRLPQIALGPSRETTEPPNSAPEPKHATDSSARTGTTEPALPMKVPVAVRVNGERRPMAGQAAPKTSDVAAKVSRLPPIKDFVPQKPEKVAKSEASMVVQRQKITPASAKVIEAPLPNEVRTPEQRTEFQSELLERLPLPSKSLALPPDIPSSAAQKSPIRVSERPNIELGVSPETAESQEGSARTYAVPATSVRKPETQVQPLIVAETDTPSPAPRENSVGGGSALTSDPEPSRPLLLSETSQRRPDAQSVNVPIPSEVAQATRKPPSPPRGKPDLLTPPLPAIAAAVPEPHPSVITSDAPPASEAVPDQVAQTTTTSASNASPTRPSAPHPPDLPQRVSDQLVQVARNIPAGAVDITLNPEELGRVRMQLIASDAGLTMMVVADRPETLDLMRRHVDHLAQEFRSLGYQSIDLSFGGNPRGRHPGAPQATHVSIAEASETEARPHPSLVATGMDIRL